MRELQQSVQERADMLQVRRRCTCSQCLLVALAHARECVWTAVRLRDVWCVQELAKLSFPPAPAAVPPSTPAPAAVGTGSPAHLAPATPATAARSISALANHALKLVDAAQRAQVSLSARLLPNRLFSLPPARLPACPASQPASRPARDCTRCSRQRRTLQSPTAPAMTRLRDTLADIVARLEAQLTAIEGMKARAPDPRRPCSAPLTRLPRCSCCPARRRSGCAASATRCSSTRNTWRQRSSSSSGSWSS